MREKLLLPWKSDWRHTRALAVRRCERPARVVTRTPTNLCRHSPTADCRYRSGESHCAALQKAAPDTQIRPRPRSTTSTHLKALVLLLHDELALFGGFALVRPCVALVALAVVPPLLRGVVRARRVPRRGTMRQVVVVLLLAQFLRRRRLRLALKHLLRHRIFPRVLRRCLPPPPTHPRTQAPQAEREECWKTECWRNHTLRSLKPPPDGDPR